MTPAVSPSSRTGTARTLRTSAPSARARSCGHRSSMVTSVQITDYPVKYVARLVRATRPTESDAPPFVKELIDWGAGPRAGQSLILGAKAMAAMDGRFNVSYDDIRKVAVPVLRHRISTNFQAQAEGQTTDTLVRRLLETIPEPHIPKYGKT